MQNQEGSILLLLNIVCLSFWGDVAGALWGRYSGRLGKKNCGWGENSLGKAEQRRAYSRSDFCMPLLKLPL